MNAFIYNFQVLYLLFFFYFFLFIYFILFFYFFASSFGGDVYAVSEDIFEDLCVICWNLWQFYVAKVNLRSYDVIKHYVY